MAITIVEPDSSNGIEAVPAHEHYLDKHGLAHVWKKIVDNFVKTSDLKTLTIGSKTYNTSAAVTVTASDLDVYTKTEVNNLLTANVKYEVVATLPAVSAASEGTIYLVKMTSGANQDYYDEYIFVPAKTVGGTSIAAHFEMIGNTKTDLSNYVTKDDVKTTVIAESTDPVSGGAVYTELAKKLDIPTTTKGSATKPVYITDAGVITEGSTYAGGTKVTLNGSNKGGSTATFFAPTAAGEAEGQYVAWPSGTSKVPAFVSPDTTPTANSGKLITSGAVSTALGGKQDTLAAAGSTTKPVYVSAAGTVSECTTYAGGTNVKLNGTSKSGSTAEFYAPAGAGTSGQYLKSSGSGAPAWQSADTTPTSSSTTLITSGAVYTALQGKVDDTDFITDAEIDEICVF